MFYGNSHAFGKRLNYLYSSIFTSVFMDQSTIRQPKSVSLWLEAELPSALHSEQEIRFTVQGLAVRIRGCDRGAEGFCV